jgi:hypothetical protein
MVKQVLEEWRLDGLIATTKATALGKTIEVTPFDWRKVAKYSFFIAIICFIISVQSILADNFIVELAKKLFSSPALFKSIVFGVMAIGFLWYGQRRQADHPDATVRNEAVLLMGALSLFGVYYNVLLALSIKTDSVWIHTSLILVMVYAGIGYVIRSKLFWVLALITLGGWLGASVQYYNGLYTLEMSYPLHYVGLGVGLIAVSYVLNKIEVLRSFYRVNLSAGLLYTFVALWILSISGNAHTYAEWLTFTKLDLVGWSVLFAGGAILSIYHGLRFDDTMTRGYGLVFLGLNLYTRLFEYFYDPLHKGVFFLILGLSLWYLGKHAEHIWGICSKKKRR